MRRWASVSAMDSVVQRILSIPTIWTYVVVALLVIAEEAMVFGLLVPGDTAAILAGVAASRGHLGIVTTLALVIVSAIVGASIGYWIGRRYGTRLLEWSIFNRHRDNLARAGEFLQRHGAWAILLGRFSTFFRTMLPELVGMSPMSFRRFVVASAAGAIIWGSVLVLAGYLLGQSFTVILKRVNTDLLIVVPIIAVLALIYWKWHRHRNAGQD
ncbi:DedA family protein [Nocardia seriolae]|uniref:VTT domain-containing protein n=2 Tax=Nocardia seriolae TaxID=37332 RepID=A0A0B8N5K5_9NOCA|nr:DedA family protein [Nocardia seriolae]GEM24706.1 membrane protein [Nocardia seriolae NBRC 15557]MTJ64580.1 DedA family protein [Nocardia seriolae]MTJ72151.1 DedA family protein [Nocardia seriolae]MTJ89423.1 DedA family protein [Nocardia seriolae]MTK33399.1 DedA family protein [Nocardia seriolae]